MNAAAPASVSPTPATPPAARRIPALDGLRAIALLLVIATHYYATIPAGAGSPGRDFFLRLTALGYSGVDLFFVLSGFLIGGILLDHRESPRLLPAFYARRAFRILPVYLLLLVTFYVGREVPGLNATNQGTYFHSLVPDWCYFVFVQNVAMAWIPDIGPYWPGPSWSLAVEEQFYLTAPVFIRRLTQRQVAWCCAVLIALSPLLRLYALYGAHNAFAGVFLLVTRADGLMWGVLCAVLMRSENVRIRLGNRGGWLAALAVAGGLIFAYASARQFSAASPQMLGWGYSVLSAWFAVILLGVILFPSIPAVRLLAWRPLVGIGITSYFSYLFHTPILLFLHWLFFHRTPQHASWPGAAVTVLALCTTFAAAWASGRWFDGPLTKRGRRFAYE